MRKNYSLAVRSYMDGNGNSYYTMRITFPERVQLDDDIALDFYMVPKTYGHGYATYIDMAERIVGAYGEDMEAVRWIVDEIRVQRKRDLHNGGK